MTAVESLKVVLIGESGVGKTSIISRYINDTFDPECVTSLGASFISKNLILPEAQGTLRFDIWDTAGQEKYRSLAKVFYKDAMIIIFVYDITKQSSFNEIKDFWYKQIKENTITNPIFAIAANKSDLYEKEQVNEKEARKFADDIGAIFKTTSALSNSGIDTLFTFIGKKYLNKNFNYKDSTGAGASSNQDEQEDNNSPSNDNQGRKPARGTKLENKKDEEKKKGCC